MFRDSATEAYGKWLVSGSHSYWRGVHGIRVPLLPFSAKVVMANPPLWYQTKTIFHSCGLLPAVEHAAPLRITPQALNQGVPLEQEKHTYQGLFLLQCIRGGSKPNGNIKGELRGVVFMSNHTSGHTAKSHHHSLSG